MIKEGHVIVYLDDILIFTENLQEHCKLMHRVLTKLREHHLYLKGSKCIFEEEILYLGLILGNGMVKMDPAKIMVVQDWVVLKNKKELHTFIGFLNYYHREFSKIMHLLHLLTGSQPFTWGQNNRRPLQI